MPSESLTEWSGSLHQTFRLLPRPSAHLEPFLSSDGSTPEEILGRLPYDQSRSRGTPREGPDPKRYRDGKQVYQTAGLCFENGDGVLRTTLLGQTTLRWLGRLTERSKPVLGRYAAYAMAACQLRNPTGAGGRYDDSMTVFPFSFIWRAMLALDGKISSDELNRALFKTKNDDDLLAAINAIRHARHENDVTLLGDEVITGQGKNDRIIPWMALASFGWVLFPDKRGGGDSSYYELDSRMSSLIREAASVKHKHRDFGSTQEYVEYVSDCACLPKDVR